jgi:hypothetical protein
VYFSASLREAVFRDSACFFAKVCRQVLDSIREDHEEDHNKGLGLAKA